jgi:hypothetical protein
MKTNRNYGLDRLSTLLRHTAEQHAGSAAHSGIDVLRVGYWFEQLRESLSAVTAYAVGKCVQPWTYQKATQNHGVYHHNLWTRYAKGQLVPGAETVRAAEVAVPGSSDWLRAVLWEALDFRRELSVSADQWLRRLRPSVQSAVYDKRHLELGLYRRRTSLAKTLEMLECQASDLDGVAALVILLREAHASNNRQRCFQIGQSLHATLLMACTSYPVRGIRFELIGYFIQYVFPLAASDDIALDVRIEEFCELAYRLNITILQLEDAELIGLVNGGSTRDWRKILHGQFGFDLQFAYSPRLKPAKACLKASAAECIASSLIAKEWGLAALREGRVERLMPDCVIKQMAGK